MVQWLMLATAASACSPLDLQQDHRQSDFMVMLNTVGIKYIKQVKNSPNLQLWVTRKAPYLGPNILI